MTTTSKFILSGLLLATFGFSSCTDSTTDDCMTVTISDADYFSVDRTLKNVCDKGVDYIIKNGTVYDQLSVQGNLVIEAGVIVEFENNGGLAIESNGSIRSMGTAADPVILRGSEGATGDWSGIMIYSDNSTNLLQYTTISGGGSSAFNSNGERGSLVLYADSKVSINNCTFQKSASYGVNANYSSVGLLAFSNNTIKDNESAMRVRPDFVHKIEANTTFMNNTNNYVHLQVGNDIETDRTWQALSVPYRLTASSGGIFPDQYIDNGATLTFEPGLIMEFEANTGISLSGNAALQAVGTATKPITFTGASKVAGFWDGIYYSQGGNPLNQLTHVIIEYAGGDSSIGAISMWAQPRLSLSNVTLRNISGCGIYDSYGLTAGVPNNVNYTATNVSFESVGNQYCE